jgi:hypothetical protein
MACRVKRKALKVVLRVAEGNPLTTHSEALVFKPKRSGLVFKRRRDK